MLKISMRGALVGLLLCLAACGEDKPVLGNANTVIPGGPGSIGSGRAYKIAPGANATRDMITAMVTVVPGDTIEFGCGFYDLTTTLQLSNTEAITIKGCGKDKTVLSFRGSNQPVGILAVNVRGLVVEDLTVADTDGNGFELRGVDHGTLRRVRAFWSTAGGRESATPITAANYATVMNVDCTDPATQNPNAPENFFGDTSSPDYTVSDKAGRYGIYPVGSENILIDDAESIGASDAGIYVGQTNNTIIRNSRAAFNVFGFEIENVQGGEYHDNIAECNTGGFLIYDLDGNLRQYGDRTRMYRNISRNNNTYNFTEGGFVGNVPPGSGMITLSYDRIDIFDNEFRDNNTGGIIHASYELFPEGDRPTEKRIDFYTEGVHIWNNKFSNNGNNLPLANTNDLYGGNLVEDEPHEPSPDLVRLLPALVGFKAMAACNNPTAPLNALQCAMVAAADPANVKANTGFRGAHIVWDGLLDDLDADCPYPKIPNNEKDDNPDVPRDARGKPQHTNQENPACHYNAYKFKPDGDRARITPDWWSSCIDASNEFSGDSLTFGNFHGLKGLEAVLAAESASPDEEGFMQVLNGLSATDVENFAASFDLAPHDCPTAYGKNLDALEQVVILPFVPSNDTDATPTPEEINTLCNAVMPAGKVNFGAARVNCPTLSQYNLFSNPQDPTSAPNSAGGDSDTNTPGVPFVLNTKLFSDYSVKYRVLFMPIGAKAVYKESSTDGPNATIIFPVGTIIAKTFSFVTNEATPVTENVVETRLLIKRVNSTSHTARWDGLAYIWETATDGTRVARFSPSGGSAAVSWNFHDADSNAPLTGSTDYQIPNANQCLSCHSREDSEAGSAPIGLKVRNLNRPYKSESPKVTDQSEEHAIKGQNQVAWLCGQNLMLGCPSATVMNVNATTQVAAGLERLPIFNKPGDSGAAPGSDADIESRARAYLEVNCQHCHNVRGFAASTGLYLNALDGPPGLAHGICKSPTATGSVGSGGFSFDIVPARADISIIPFRISDDADDSAAARMPPLARSVTHDEGHALITKWIDDVIVRDNSKYPNSEKEGCGG
ncbi:MAG: parallel beta-helix domain-containing protein [Pseudomonadota bacterium]